MRSIRNFVMAAWLDFVAWADHTLDALFDAIPDLTLAMPEHGLYDLQQAVDPFDGFAQKRKELLASAALSAVDFGAEVSPDPFANWSEGRYRATCTACVVAMAVLAALAVYVAMKLGGA